MHSFYCIVLWLFVLDSNPFPPGVKVNLHGDDYLCDNCVQPVNGENAVMDGCKFFDDFLSVLNGIKT